MSTHRGALTLLEKLRLDAGYELVDLHHRSGVPVRTIRELEARRVRRPGLRTLRPLAKALKCKPSELAEDLRSTAVEAPVDATVEPTAEAA